MQCLALSVQGNLVRIQQKKGGKNLTSISNVPSALIFAQECKHLIRTSLEQECKHLLC